MHVQCPGTKGKSQRALGFARLDRNLESTAHREKQSAEIFHISVSTFKLVSPKILQLGTLWKKKSDHSEGLNTQTHPSSSQQADLRPKSICCVSYQEVKTSIFHQATWRNYCIYTTATPDIFCALKLQNNLFF